MARPRGRKPLPSYLKLVKNTARSDRVNRSEALPPPAMPMPPEFLSDEAKVEWGRVCDELYSVGLLTKIDRAALACYCQAYGRWQLAEQALRAVRAANPADPTFGLLHLTKTKNIINNPLIGIANKAMHDLMKYATDLGMTPSARSRVTAKPPGDTGDPSDEFLG